MSACTFGNYILQDVLNIDFEPCDYELPNSSPDRPSTFVVEFVSAMPCSARYACMQGKSSQHPDARAGTNRQHKQQPDW